jgi:uncharacterized membrane protein
MQMQHLHTALLVLASTSTSLQLDSSSTRVLPHSLLAALVLLLLISIFVFIRNILVSQLLPRSPTNLLLVAIVMMNQTQVSTNQPFTPHIRVGNRPTTP